MNTIYPFIPNCKVLTVFRCISHQYNIPPARPLPHWMADSILCSSNESDGCQDYSGGKRVVYLTYAWWPVTVGFEGCEQENFPICGMNGGPIHDFSGCTAGCFYAQGLDLKFSSLANHGFLVINTKKAEREKRERASLQRTPAALERTPSYPIRL